MTWEKHVLVVANVTVTSRELVQALKATAAQQAVKFTLVVPATPFGGGRAAATKRLKEACEQLGQEGLHVDGLVGHSDPCVAVMEVWDPKSHDEIIVATLPMRFSKWLRAGLPERISRLTGAPVRHVISQPHPELEVVPAPSHQSSPLGPLDAFGWGAHHSEGD
jgi:GABA permease